MNGVRRLHEQGGMTLREVSEATLATGPRISHAAVGKLVNGVHLPRYKLAMRVIEALGGSKAQFDDLWYAASAEVTASRADYGVGRVMTTAEMQRETLHELRRIRELLEQMTAPVEVQQ